jgi:hypothetical protein
MKTDMKYVITIILLTLALVPFMAVAANSHIVRGEVVSKRQIDDVEQRLLAWCSSVGGHEPMPGLNTASSVLCALSSGPLVQINLVPGGGGVRVQWTTANDTTDQLGAAIADAVQ